MPGQQLWTNGWWMKKSILSKDDYSSLLAETDNNSKAEKRWWEDGVTQLRILIMRSVDWTQKLTKSAGAWRDAWRIPKPPSEISKEAFRQDQSDKGSLPNLVMTNTPTPSWRGDSKRDASKNTDLDIHLEDSLRRTSPTAIGLRPPDFFLTP